MPSSSPVGAADAAPESSAAEPDLPAVNGPDPARGELPMVQRQVETGVKRVKPPELAPLVPDATSMTSVAVAAAETPATGSTGSAPSAALGPSPVFLQRSADTPLPPPSPLTGWNSVEAATETPPTGAADAAAGAPSRVQRRAEAEGDAREVAPLVSDSTSMTSVATPPAVTPSTDPGAESGFTGSPPSPMPLQRVADIRPVPVPDPGELPPARPSEQIDAGIDPVRPAEVTPLVSDGPPMTSVTVSPAETPSTPSSEAGASSAPAAAGPPPAFAQHAVDTAVPAEPGQDETDIKSGESAEVAPLVSDATSMTSVIAPPGETPSSIPGTRLSSAGQVLSPAFVQRMADSSSVPEPEPVELSSGEVPSVTPSESAAADSAAAAPSPVQRWGEASAELVEPAEVAPLVSDATLMTSVAVPPAEGALSPAPGTRSSSADQALSPGFVQRTVDAAQRPGPAPVWPPLPEQIAEAPAPAAAGPSPVQRRAEASVDPVKPVDPVKSPEAAPLVSDSAPMASVVPSATMPFAEPMTRPGSAGPGSFLRFVQRAVDTFQPRGQRMARAPSTEPAAATPMPAAAAPASPGPSAVPAEELMEVAPLVSDSEPTALVVMRSPESSSPARSPDEGLTIQRAAGTAPPTTELPLAHVDHPVADLIGDRPIEPAVPDHGTAVEPAGGSVAAPLTVEGRLAGVPISGRKAPTPTAVQRSVGASTYPPPRRPLDLPAVRQSFSAAEPQASPSQPIQFIQYVPAPTSTVVADYPPQQNSELAVQRAAEDEPLATTEPAPVTGPAPPDSAAAPGAADTAAPGQHTGSTSPTEIDNLVRRLYDPIVQRLKAELQLDRERAGRSLDLWH